MTPLQIDDNEYGSDFSSDEERLVNSLLDQVSTPAKSQGKHAAISVATSPLAGLGVGSVAAKPTPTRGLWPSASGANRPPYTAPVVTAVISPTTRVTRSVTKAAAIRLPLDPAAIEAELAAAIAADVTIDGSLLPEDANDLGAALDPALASAFGDPVATSSSSSKRGARSPLSHQDVRPADGGRNRSRGSDSSGANWLESASWATTTWAQKSSKVWSAKGGASVSAKGEPGGVLYPDRTYLAVRDGEGMMRV